MQRTVRTKPKFCFLRSIYATVFVVENVHDRNTVYKKYIFFSLERFSSDK